MSDAVKVFISYAHEDEAFREKLEEHLSILQRGGIISAWHDRKITPGREWAGLIDKQLESAHLILLLVSSSFLASDYAYNVEMEAALKRHNRGEAVVIPIILRPVVWEQAPFGKLQALPRDAKPVSKWGDRNEAFVSIVNGIAAAANLIRTKAADGPPRIESAAEERRVESPPAHGLPRDVQSTLRDMKFVLIQPGTFTMGSANGEENEKPPHIVTIPRAFYMGAAVVTQAEWKAVMGTEPWKGREFVVNGDRYPAVYVSWIDAKAFISKLNSSDSDSYYRLPTEEEWEYCARAGTTTEFSFGDDARVFNAYGWYKANSYDAGVSHPQQIALKRPNAWGLYDMHGNVWEWVEDWYYGSYEASRRPDPDEKVVRGGGYDYSAYGARSAFRNHVAPQRSNHVIGFRLVREPL